MTIGRETAEKIEKVQVVVCYEANVVDVVGSAMCPSRPSGLTAVQEQTGVVLPS